MKDSKQVIKLSKAKIALGRRLRLARESAGLSQSELVDKLGRKRVTDISRYENGHQRMFADELPAYARACGVSVLFFFEDVATENDIEAEALTYLRRRPAGERLRVWKVMRGVGELIKSIPKSQTPKSQHKPTRRT